MMNSVEPRSDARLNRERIIAAARALFSERGLDVEMREIAERAGLAVGTIYRNYPSKEDLTLALLEEVATLNAAHVREIEALAGGDARDQLRLLLIRSLQALGEYGWLVEALWGGRLPPQWRSRLQTESNTDCLRRIIEEGIAQQVFDPDIDIETAVGVIVAPLIFPVRPPRTNWSAEEAADAVMRLFLHGAASPRNRGRAR